MKVAYEDKEKFIGQLFMGSVGCSVFGIVITALALILGSFIFYIIGPFSLFVGIAMGIGGLYLGFNHNKVMESGFERPQQEGRITARFAINDIGEMIFDNLDVDAEEARYYVKVQFLGGRREEFETARPVFDACGEGMRGMLTLQGSWLAQFVPLADTEESRAAYRDW